MFLNAEETILRLQELRKQPFAQRATIILAPENNLHSYAYDMMTVLRLGKLQHLEGHKDDPIKLCNYVMYRNGDKYGVVTNEPNRSSGSNTMYGRVRSSKLLIWELAPRENFKILVDQMSKWRQVLNKNGKYVYRSPGGKSDHIMALIVGINAFTDWPGVEKVSVQYKDTCNICYCDSGCCGQKPEFVPVKRIRLF